jgi:hypothetical protein
VKKIASEKDDEIVHFSTSNLQQPRIPTNETVEQIDVRNILTQSNPSLVLDGVKTLVRETEEQQTQSGTRGKFPFEKIRRGVTSKENSPNNRMVRGEETSTTGSKTLVISQSPKPDASSSAYRREPESPIFLAEKNEDYVYRTPTKTLSTKNNQNSLDLRESISQFNPSDSKTILNSDWKKSLNQLKQQESNFLREQNEFLDKTLSNVKSRENLISSENKKQLLKDEGSRKLDANTLASKEIKLNEKNNTENEGKPLSSSMTKNSTIIDGSMKQKASLQKVSFSPYNDSLVRSELLTNINKAKPPIDAKNGKPPINQHSITLSTLGQRTNTNDLSSSKTPNKDLLNVTNDNKDVSSNSTVLKEKSSNVHASLNSLNGSPHKDIEEKIRKIDEILMQSKIRLSEIDRDLTRRKNMRESSVDFKANSKFLGDSRSNENKLRTQEEFSFHKGDSFLRDLNYVDKALNSIAMSDDSKKISNSGAYTLLKKSELRPHDFTKSMGETANSVKIKPPAINTFYNQERIIISDSDNRSDIELETPTLVNRPYDSQALGKDSSDINYRMRLSDSEKKMRGSSDLNNANIMNEGSERLFQDIGAINKANNSYSDIKNELEDIFHFTKMSNNNIEEPRKRVLFEKNSNSDVKLPEGPILWKKTSNELTSNDNSNATKSEDARVLAKGTSFRSKSELSKVFKYILFLYIMATVFFSLYKIITYITTS